MLNGKTFLAIISARGGSKGIPYKNIRDLGGKPLIAWTIETAQKSQYIDRLILSSEDDQIIKVAREWGCEVAFVRPAELAKDDTPGIEPVIHAINTLNTKYDYVVLLQPTSPMRSVLDIDYCIEQCLQRQMSACVSVTEAKQNPYWMYSLDKQMKMNSFVEYPGEISRRQDLPPVYVLNGAVYVAESDFLIKNKSFVTSSTIAYVMPEERSADIDEEIDFLYCECLIRQREIVKLK